MARHESDREDLIRKATALVPRIEWCVPGEPQLVVTGIKTHGGLSVYFGGEPVYQFDVRGGLRRGFVDGFLLRTQGSTLARLHRERTETTSTLIRRDLPLTEVDAILTTMDDRLRMLLEAIESGTAVPLRQVPADAAPNETVTAIRQALTAERRLAPAIPGRG